MKRSDIKVGGTYAWTSSDWEYRNGTAQKAEVLSIDAEVTQGWGYNSKKVKGSLVKVHRSDGVTFTKAVHNRELREEWIAYHERHAALAKARQKQDENRAAAQRRRASTLPTLLRALEEAGFEPTEAHVYDYETADLLREVVPTLVVDKDERRGTYLRAPLAECAVQYVRSNSAFAIRARDLAGLLGVVID